MNTISGFSIIQSADRGYYVMPAGTRAEADATAQGRSVTVYPSTRNGAAKFLRATRQLHGYRWHLNYQRATELVRKAGL